MGGEKRSQNKIEIMDESGCNTTVDTSRLTDSAIENSFGPILKVTILDSDVLVSLLEESRPPSTSVPEIILMYQSLSSIISED